MLPTTQAAFHTKKHQVASLVTTPKGHQPGRPGYLVKTFADQHYFDLM